MSYVLLLDVNTLLIGTQIFGTDHWLLRGEGLFEGIGVGGQIGVCLSLVLE